VLPTATAGEPLHLPSKRRNSRPFPEERKEAIGTTRTLQDVTYPAYPSSRNTAGAPEGKKNSKQQLQGHKRLKP
jgi:hypothetical protein